MSGVFGKTLAYFGYDQNAATQPEYYEEYDVPKEKEAEMATWQPELPETLTRITAVHPRSYNDARAIGEAFRSGVPVIMNVSDMSDADAKRLVDFSAGLIFGLHGRIEKITTKVFLLSPAHVEIESETTPAQPPAAGFYNQS